MNSFASSIPRSSSQRPGGTIRPPTALSSGGSCDLATARSKSAVPVALNPRSARASPSVETAVTSADPEATTDHASVGLRDDTDGPGVQEQPHRHLQPRPRLTGRLPKAHHLPEVFGTAGPDQGVHAPACLHDGEPIEGGSRGGRAPPRLPLSGPRSPSSSIRCPDEPPELPPESPPDRRRTVRWSGQSSADGAGVLLGSARTRPPAGCCPSRSEAEDEPPPASAVAAQIAATTNAIATSASNACGLLLRARSMSITSFRSSRVRECGRTRASRARRRAGAAPRRRR